MMLSQKIKEYRALKGWTQDDLAKFSGVSLPSIKRYEMGNDNITTTNLKKIASALDVNIINFMSPNMSTNREKCLPICRPIQIILKCHKNITKSI